MLQTPDGHGRLELFEYLHPDAIETEPTRPTDIGMHRVAFLVDDIDAALEIAARHGCHPLRGVATYEDLYKLTYLRGPSGILVMLAQDLRTGRPRGACRRRRLPRPSAGRWSVARAEWIGHPIALPGEGVAMVDAHVRLMTWNVWWRFGPRWPERQPGIRATIGRLDLNAAADAAVLRPLRDVLTDAWSAGGGRRPAVARPLIVRAGSGPTGAVASGVQHQPDRVSVLVAALGVIVTALVRVSHPPADTAGPEWVRDVGPYPPVMDGEQRARWRPGTAVMDRLREALLREFSEDGVVRVEFVPTFSPPFRFWVWLGTDTDARGEELTRDGTVGERIVEAATRLDLGAPYEGFTITSQETVDRDYEGSWFYRLR